MPVLSSVIGAGSTPPALFYERVSMVAHTLVWVTDLKRSHSKLWGTGCTGVGFGERSNPTYNT
ncbi:MAG: hypothetical protein JSW64_00325 [Candidatus Zixiibacteriota bacterium]|nr:MAG: hypothetical protein JSW64_00325 [candidate division Zixibacteria bacterium]